MNNNYQERPLGKYLPNSPSSPHMYPQDSFEAEQLSRSIPHAPFPPHNYELTFKKDTQERYFAKQPPKNAARALFPPNQQSLLQEVRLPLEEYHAKSLEQLSRLPFADLMSMDLPQMLREKLGIIGQILQVKRVRMKASSVGVNLRCLQVKESLTHEEKHRVFLLELLWKQLSKKLFIQALKVNLAERKYHTLFAEKQKEMLFVSQQQQSHRIRQQFLQEQHQEEEQYSRQNNNLWGRQEQQQKQDDSENLEQKMMIFYHSLEPIFNKQSFFAFNRIIQAKPNNKGAAEPSYESIPLVSRPNIKEDSRDPQQLQELHAYIEELHEQCADSQNLLKKYFIKLKIKLLQSIAQSMIIKIKGNSLYPPQEQTSFHHNRQIQQEQYEQQNRDSRYTSQLSQDGSLKTQKRQLKEYLRASKIQSFYSQLKRYYQGKRIESICVQMYKGSMLNRAFRALLQNVKDEQFERQMQDYYQEIANEQVQDDGTSRFFHKTNLFYKYFQKLKENRRNQRMVRTLNSILLKLTFRLVKFHSFSQERHRIIAEKHSLKLKERLMFKCFIGWKQVYLNQNCLNDRFRIHMQMKQRDTLQHYFSIMKLHFKKALIKQRKIDQYFQQKLRSKVFMALKCIYQDSKQMKERSERLQDYLRFQKGGLLMRNLNKYYIDYTAYQRFSIKQQKLRRMLIRLHALQGIKQWRKSQIRKQAYSAIEMKLVRFKNKQRKRQILGRWLQRTQSILYGSGQSSPSDNHKDWLVKYYSNLCSFLPS